MQITKKEMLGVSKVNVSGSENEKCALEPKHPRALIFFPLEYKLLLTFSRFSFLD